MQLGREIELDYNSYNFTARLQKQLEIKLKEECTDRFVFGVHSPTLVALGALKRGPAPTNTTYSHVTVVALCKTLIHSNRISIRITLEGKF